MSRRKLLWITLGAKEHRVDLQLPASEHTLRVRVRDAQGAPAAADVFLRGIALTGLRYGNAVAGRLVEAFTAPPPGLTSNQIWLSSNAFADARGYFLLRQLGNLDYDIVVRASAGLARASVRARACGGRAGRAQWEFLRPGRSTMCWTRGMRWMSMLAKRWPAPAA